MSFLLTEAEVKNMPSKFDAIMNYEKTNRVVYNSLCRSIDNKMGGVLPFVGAGISAFAYKTWGDLLLEFSQNISTKDRHKVEKAVEMGEYFDATDLLSNCYGEALLYEELREFFSEDKINDDELKKSAAFLIPKLCKGNCITTNFDKVLEHACHLNNIVPDKAIPTNTNHLNEYLRNGSKRSGLIFKIHGDILSNKNDIVLTGKSYDTHYGVDTPLRKQLTRWIDSRKLLFLGASLKQDRTVDILRERMEEGMYNYAIYGCKKEKIPELKQHFEALNIMSIFYDSSNHECVRTILLQLIKDLKL